MFLSLTLVILVLAAVLAGHQWPRQASAIAAVGAAAVAVLLAGAWAVGSLALDLPFLPSIGSRLLLRLDGLGAPLVVYSAGMAVPVLAWAAAYMPRHLEHEERPIAAAAPFAGLLLGFMLAMVLLMLAQDLLVLFIALELTAVISFLLIRFDEHEEARAAARLALVVTAGSSLLFLLGLLIVAAEAGTTVLPVLRREGVEVSTLAAICLTVGVLGKSAQVPLHIWLPRAMKAPTPVSAYLHSAALVAAGVFVLQRIRFLLETAPGVLDGLYWFAFLSIFVGGLFALIADEFKRVLAYSTIAQYGYGVALVAAGGTAGLVGAPFFIVAHGLGKCALFMTAGAVTIRSGEDRLSQSGGLARAMPLLAAASAVAAAGVAGLPLTIGFFKDELLFKAALERGPLAAAATTLAVALSLAYLARFWSGIFLGPQRRAPSMPLALVLPIAALSLLTLLGGIWTAPLEPVFAAAAEVISGEPHEAHLAYPTELSAELLLTLTAWAGGALLWLASGRMRPALDAAGRFSARWGVAALADRAGGGANALSDLVHRLEVRDARDRLSAIFLASAGFVLVGTVSDGDWPRLGAFDDPALAAVLLAAAAAAMVAVRPAGHLAFVLLLSFVGFTLALAFALAHAPDVALVLALVEAMLTLLFLAVLSQMRPAVLERARRQPGTRRSVLIGAGSGVVASVTAWLALSAPRADTPVPEYLRLTELAHGKDVVTVILADFRGLDTAGEVTVLVVAVFGAAAIWMGRQA